MTDLLTVQDVTKNFGGLVAVNKVSIKLEQGKIYGLIGPNGSGKTTLVNLITGVLKPNGGEIFFRGNAIARRSPHRIARMGIGRTFQIPRMFEHLTARESLLAVSPSNDEEALANMEEFLSLAGLSEFADTRCKNLGYGQRKQLEFARVLALNPELVILDEPLSGIDFDLRKDLMDHVRKVHVEYGKTYLIIEHLLDELMNLAEWIFVLDHGVKISEGNPETVKQSAEVHAAYFGR